MTDGIFPLIISLIIKGKYEFVLNRIFSSLFPKVIIFFVETRRKYSRVRNWGLFARISGSALLDNNLFICFLVCIIVTYEKKSFAFLSLENNLLVSMKNIISRNPKSFFTASFYSISAPLHHRA